MRHYLKILLTALLFIPFSVHAYAEGQKVQVFSYNAARQESTVTVPYQPQRIAVIDFAALDIIDSLGYGNHVVAIAKSTPLPYLKKYIDNKNIVNVGSVKEVDMEKLIASKPDIIFIGGRLASKYDALSKIAPVVYIGVDHKKGLLPSLKRNAEAIASIFNHNEDRIQNILHSYDIRIAKLREQAKGHTALMGLVTGGHFNTLGNSSTGAFIGRDIGFNNLAQDISATHGNESSFELLAKLNPEYIFVMDRDSALARQGAKVAQDIMNNALVEKTQAYKNNHVIYLNPGVWYLAEGGLHATDTMIHDIEKAFPVNK